MIQTYDNLNTALSTICDDHIQNPKLIPISGGDINEAFCVELENIRLFAKRHKPNRLANFADECAGLVALSRGALDTAKPLALVQDKNHSWLVLEWIASGQRHNDFWTIFGTKLAQQHLTVTAKAFGWQETWEDNWIDFFRNHRLLPKLKQTWTILDNKSRRLGDNLITKLDQRLTIPTQPELLHGDLWHGNFIINENGQATLIDPHAYYGHGEADLALTQLFGGFHNNFLQSYAETYHLDKEFSERADIYNLYHLLNHLYLFGKAYLPACERILQKYG